MSVLTFRTSCAHLINSGFLEKKSSALMMPEKDKRPRKTYYLSCQGLCHFFWVEAFLWLPIISRTSLKSPIHYPKVSLSCTSRCGSSSTLEMNQKQCNNSESAHTHTHTRTCVWFISQDGHESNLCLDHWWFLHIVFQGVLLSWRPVHRTRTCVSSPPVQCQN